MPAPYDSAQAILNVARQRLLDVIATPSGAPSGQVGGEVLNTAGASAAFTQTLFNSAYRKMLEFLAQKQFSKLLKTTILDSAVVVDTLDPAVNCAITYDGYYDGANLDAAGPTLPEDMISPIWLRERVHQDDEEEPPNQFSNMEYVTNGITGTTKQARNFNWGWDNEEIVLPGSTEVMDFELRYASYLPDIIDDSPVAATEWYDQKVPIVRCMDALAYYVVAEAANARGDVDGAALETKAEAAATRLVEREQSNDAARMQWSVPDIPAQTGATPYDICLTVLDMVRSRLNSAAGLNVDVLTAAQTFTQRAFNTGWRKLQEFLMNKGYTPFTDEVIIAELAPIDGGTAADPSLQVYLSWDGYYDGATLDDTKVLPQALVFPLKIYQRPSNQNSNFVPVEMILDGIPTAQHQLYQYGWEWRVDRIYMPGAVQELDLRIRYAKFHGDFQQDADTGAPWYLSTVPIARCSDALSLYVCAELALSRPDLEIDPLTFKDQAEMSANLLFNRDVRAKQRVNVRRMSRSGRLEGQQYVQ